MCDEGRLVQIAAIVEIADLDKLGNELRVRFSGSEDAIVKRVDVDQNVADIEKDGHEKVH